MNIPFLDWASHHRIFEKQWLKDAQEIYRSGIFLKGAYGAQFENHFCRYCESEEVSSLSAIGTGNGLDALYLSLRALDLPQGSEVIIPGNTYIATALAVIHAGLTPVLAPPSATDYNLDPAELDSCFSENTVAVLPVHLCGRVCDMDLINSWAKQKKIVVIEDAAHAHGAIYKGKKAGSFGDAAGFSFYPGKNLGALGDAGAVVTPSTTTAQKVRSMQDYGSLQKYEHEDIGINSRMDELQAAFLSHKLAHLDSQLEHRRHLAQVLIDELPDELVLPPPDDNDYQSAWHLFVIRHPQRERLSAYLASKGIQCMIHYPRSIDQHNALKTLKLAPCTVSRRLAGEILSLPIGPHVNQGKLEYIIKQVRAFFGR